MSKRGIGTRAVHGAKDPRPGPLTVPIVQSSTFVFGSSAEMQRYLEGDEQLYLYSRYENPTLRELEHTLAALEEGEAALVLSSGMAASTTGLLSLLKAGDEVVASASLYGGTTRLVREVLPSLGVTSRIVPPGDLAGSLAGPRTKAVVVESPTNPSLDVVDLRAVCAAAHDHGVAVMVDNTFATPILQQPLRLGADLGFQPLAGCCRTWSAVSHLLAS